MTFRTFNRKAIVLPMALISLLTAPAAFVPSSDSPGVAQAQEGYTLASLQGTFACHWIAGAQVGAGFGVYTFHSNGNYTSTSDLANIPTPQGGRQVIPLTDVGTYAVNAGGIVVLSSTYTYPAGSFQVSWDFVVTQAVRSSVGASLVATEISGMQREPSVLTGDLLTCVCKRLPDEGVFTKASLQGTYALIGTIGPNVAGALGLTTWDGNGNGAGSSIGNEPAPDGGRLVYPVTTAGTNTVNADGTGTASGTITFPTGTQPYTSDFIITQAKVVGGVRVATEYFAMQRQARPGLFTTYLFKRLPD